MVTLMLLYCHISHVIDLGGDVFVDVSSHFIDVVLDSAFHHLHDFI